MQESDPRSLFIEKLRASIEKDSFLKLILSKLHMDNGVIKILLSRTKIKEREMLNWHYTYPNRDMSENVDLEESVLRLETCFSKVEARDIYLFTSGETVQIKATKKGKWHMIISLPDQSSKFHLAAHDKQKNYLIDAAAPFLRQLGISSTKGLVHQQAQKKFRQINKFVEIFASLIPEESPSNFRVVDMGCGHGYLTFAVHEYLTNHTDLNPDVLGLELRPELVDKCNKIAAELALSGIRFEAADISSYASGDMDVLIALHACDTATDLAIIAGLAHKAKVIILAPCCQKQVRRDMLIPDHMKPLLKHGIHLERQAEMLTNAIRGLYLEAAGYRVKIFEFIGSEHTAKNIMITAEKTVSRPDALAEIDAIKIQFGVKHHYLDGKIDLQN